MPKLSLKDLALKNKKILMRVDFNVPLKEGAIADDTRIRAALPSIKYVINEGGSLILMSHLGKPKGKDPKLSLVPCAKRLSELLNMPVIMARDCIGEEVEREAKALKPKQILLLENLRFYNAEEHPDNDPSFAEKLSKLGDIYVNEAFGTAHRNHSSTAAIARFFKGKAALGFLMEKEITFLNMALENPKRPFFAIIGGSKISSKIGVLLKLVDKADALFIGGGMLFTFLKAKGIEIGDSLFEENELHTVEDIFQKAKQKTEIYLASDVVITDNSENIKIINCKDGIPKNWKGMDIGPKTVKEWSSLLNKAATIFWNGPLGVFENPAFAKGTNGIALAMASTKAITIVGGGDSLAAINNLKIEEKFSHLSTGGGAALEYIEYGTLPGIEALGSV